MLVGQSFTTNNLCPLEALSPGRLPLEGLSLWGRIMPPRLPWLFVSWGDCCLGGCLKGDGLLADVSAGGPVSW